jgi:hypothetical protein
MYNLKCVVCVADLLFRPALYGRFLHLQPKGLVLDVLLPSFLPSESNIALVAQ